MTQSTRAGIAFGVMAILLAAVGFGQSWSVALVIINLCLISAVMALGLNIQWGYAGLFNAGVMGFAAIGGVSAVLVSHAPVTEAWTAGGLDLLIGLAIFAVIVGGGYMVQKKLPEGPIRRVFMIVVILIGYWAGRGFFSSAVDAIESVDPVRTGFLGGLGLPIIFSWVVGGVLAAGVAWLIGKIALGLRADYFAIATLGISEIVVALLKNEDWLTRGVKNVSGLSRPVPFEIDLQTSDWFIGWVERLHGGTLAAASAAERQDVLNQLVISSSGIFVKLCYSALFLAVTLIILGLCVRALNSPWGRMMRAIRDSEHAAAAMGKDITFRQRQVFILGSAIIGVGGAMLTTLDGQFTPGSYVPLRFTFLIWVMVIVGGSGNNLGSVLGGFMIWFVWIEAEPVSSWALGHLAGLFADGSMIAERMLDAAPHMRVLLLGLILILVLRFSPRGILPEYVRQVR